MQHDEQSRSNEDYRVQVLSRIFSILDELAVDSRQELGGTEIADRVGLHKSTVHRLMAVLEQNRFVEKNPSTARYRLGWRLFELGNAVMSGVDLYERARPEVSRLVDQTGETAHIGILRQGKIVSLCNTESRRSVRTPATVGRQTPFHCTSQGKAIFAFLPEDQVETALRDYHFQEFTAKTICTQARFRAELAIVKRRGYAIDDEEFEEGLRCIGAPVRDHSEQVIAAISIAGPCFRIKNDRIPELSMAVRQAAARLSAAMGYRASIATERRVKRKERIVI